MGMNPTIKEIEEADESFDEKFEEYLKLHSVISDRRIIYLENDFSREKVKSFYVRHSHLELLKVIDSLIEELENGKKKMKETHACAFNDGEQNCHCYLECLFDTLTYLKEVKEYLDS